MKRLHILNIFLLASFFQAIISGEKSLPTIAALIQKPKIALAESTIRSCHELFPDHKRLSRKELCARAKRFREDSRNKPGRVPARGKIKNANNVK